jgi:hypothetical protein
MQFAADYSETLEIFFLTSTDGIRGHFYVSQSVVCEMATVNEFFPVYLILPAALLSGLYYASNRNEYQKQKNNVVANRWNKRPSLRFSVSCL